MDASPHIPSRRARPGLGRMFLHTLWFRQFVETDQVGEGWTGRYGLVEPGRQLLQAVLAACPPCNGSYNHQLVHLSVWRVRNGETI